MINTIFHFVNDPTFDYQTAVNNGDISEYTIVFNSADHSIHCKGAMFGRMSRADMAETLGNISDLIPVATDSTLGGIKIGYTNDSDQDSRRYGVVLDSNNKAYVEVPWSDTITPDYDDSAVKALIATERSRIDNFISTLSSTIDAKNRELLADAQWVQEVFGVPQAEGTIWQQFENEIDHYLNEYMVWDWVNPNDHTQGRIAKISSIEQDIDGITTRVGTTEERLDNADGEGVTIETFVSTIKQTANDIDAHVGRVETKADTNTGAIQSTNVAVSNLELSVNGFYKVTIVSAPSPDTSVNISTISAQLSDRTTALTNNEKLNGKLFTTAPTENVIYKKGSQYFKLNKVDGAVESLAGLTASVSEYKGDMDDIATNMDDLVTIVASTLQLKANETDSRYISTSDLASVIANGRYNAYAGLNATVQATYNNLSDLSDDVSDLAGDLSDLSSSVVLSSNLNSELSNCTAFTNLQTTVNGITGISTAQASLLATIDNDDWAGFMATVTKDSTTTPATYTTTAKIHADNIILDGNTFANSIFADLVDTTTLTTGYATITNLNAATARITDLEADNVTINNELTAAKATFTGELIGATGSFSGDVQANAFRAGSTTGFNISVESDSINFNYGDTPRAWFSTKKYVESTNGPVEDTSATNAGGFYLYMISPETGNLVTIDFANLTFKEITSSGRPTPHTKNLIKLTNGTRTGEVKSETYTVYYTDDDGNGNAAPIAYYYDPALTTPLTNAMLTNVYVEDPPKDYYNVEYRIAILYNSGSYYAKDNVTRYRGVVMSGTDITTSGGYVYSTTYGSGSNIYNRYCTPNATAGNFTDSNLANGGGAYKFSGGQSNGTYYIQYASSKTPSTGAMSFFKVNTSGTAIERLQVSAVS